MSRYRSSWFALASMAMVSCGGPAAAQSNLPVLLFGGYDHKEFLGCLTCAELDPNSVWNDFSQYGWRNGFATWNPFGQYKNPFSPYSACNELATDPPVMVDRS